MTVWLIIFAFLGLILVLVGAVVAFLVLFLVKADDRDNRSG